MVKEKTLVPKLRFPQFENNWQISNLEHLISKIDSGWSPQCESIPAEEDSWGILKTTSVVWDGFFENQNKALPPNLKPRPAIEVKTGDILITRAGPTDRVGVVAHVSETKGKRMLSDKLIRITTGNENSSKFITFVLKSKKCQNYLSALKSGLAKAQTNISQSDLKGTKVTLPSLPEQEKIAVFLTSVDDRIEQLKRKKSLLQDYKKGVMQRLFSQQLRFKDNNGNNYPDWEEKKLGEIAKIYQPKTISQGDLTSEGFPVYGANGVIGNYSEYNHELTQVAVTCRGSTCGVVNLTQPKSWITGNAMVVNLDHQPSPFKKYIYFTLIHSDLRYLITGSGQPQITGEIKNHKVNLPAIEEQTKIANYLSNLDTKINQVTQQTTQTQTFKKGLLQQMFV